MTGAGARRLPFYARWLKIRRRARGAGGPHGKGRDRQKRIPPNRKKWKWGNESRHPWGRPFSSRGVARYWHGARRRASGAADLPWASSSARRHPEGSALLNAGREGSGRDFKRVLDRTFQAQAVPGVESAEALCSQIAIANANGARSAPGKNEVVVEGEVVASDRAKPRSTSRASANGPGRRGGAIEYLSAKDAAKELGVHADTVRSAIDRGELYALKSSGVWQIARRDLEAYLKRRCSRDVRQVAGVSTARRRKRNTRFVTLYHRTKTAKATSRRAFAMVKGPT